LAAPKHSADTLLPVQLVTRAADVSIELVLPNGCVARVSRGFDEETLQRLMSLSATH
jgi:hypothetical protein